MLRTALSLSCILGIPFKMSEIRVKRPKPGLQPQHLAAVNAAAQISGAKMHGAELGSTSLFFEPHEVKAGNYFFSIGTAGSAVLLFQTVLPILLFCKEESKLKIIGGTCNPFAPPFPFLEKVFSPLLKKMNAFFCVESNIWGFYPVGGGVIGAEIKPVSSGLKKILLEDRGKLLSLKGVSAAALLPNSIAERQKKSCLTLLSSNGFDAIISLEKPKSSSPGSLVFLSAEFENSIAGFSGLGERGKPAEKVGEEAAQQFLEFFSSNAGVDFHLGDQLMLYASLAEGESVIKPPFITEHMKSNAEVINSFFGNRIRFDDGLIKISGKGIK